MASLAGLGGLRIRPSMLVALALLVGFGLLGLLGSAGAVESLRVSQGIDLMKFMGMGLSMAVIMSYAGYVSFGHSMFIGLGGFAASIVVVKMYADEIKAAVEAAGRVDWGLLASIVAFSVLIAAGLSALVAVLVGAPVLRLRGAFFAIATIGLNFVLLNIVRFLLKQMEMTEYGDEVPFENMGLSTIDYYWIYYVFFVVTVLVAYFVRVSKFGYGLSAIREDEDAAEIMGVNTFLYKVVAFAIAGVLASLWGVADALKTSYTAGEYFSLLHSIIMILENSIGGIGTFVGPVIGAFIYYPLRWVTQTATAQMAFFILGAIIVVVVSFVPRGIAGLLKERFPQLRKYLE